MLKDRKYLGTFQSAPSLNQPTIFKNIFYEKYSLCVFVVVFIKNNSGVRGFSFFLEFWWGTAPRAPYIPAVTDYEWPGLFTESH